MCLIHFPAYPGCSQSTDGESWEALLGQHPPLETPYQPTLEGLWTILYTSGTTGVPKGVMLPYRCPVRFMEHERRHADFGMFGLPVYRLFSYLPLNHIAERIAIEVAGLYRGAEISFAESVETFARNVQETQPTFFFGVPRIWQRIQQGVFERLGGPARYARLTKIPLLGPLLKAYIRRKLGLGQVQLALTGGAITPDPIKAWFHELGIPLREVYAMTENCAGCTVMPRGHHKSGTVGKPLTEVRLCIDPETHEILMWADWVMNGYYKDPERTAEVLRDGWLHTGDTGRLDEEGFLHITGRLKDTFKTAKGLFVVPEPLETAFAQLPFVEQVCVVGLGLAQLLLLATLSELGHKTPRTEVEATFLRLLESVNEPLPFPAHCPHRAAFRNLEPQKQPPDPHPQGSPPSGARALQPLLPGLARPSRPSHLVRPSTKTRHLMNTNLNRYYFTEEHELFRESLRRFLEKEVLPHIDEWEAQQQVPKSLWRKFGEQGFLGLHYPPEYGGAGLDFFYTVVFAEEVSRVFSGGFGVIPLVTLTCPPLTSTSTAVRL